MKDLLFSFSFEIKEIFCQILFWCEINMPQITVFTGFLGAGKTSIILSLLAKLPKDYKIVLLKNEFGDIKGK